MIIDTEFRNKIYSSLIAAFISTIAGNPFDIIKTRIQSQQIKKLNFNITNKHHFPECLIYDGSLNIFNKIVKQEGIHTLWKGTNLNLLMAIPNIGFYLPFYDILYNYFKNNGLDNLAPVLSGIISRTLVISITSPIDFIRTRIQSNKEVRNIIKNSNTNPQILILWTGLRSHLFRDVPFSAIYWGCMSYIRNKYYLLTNNYLLANCVGGFTGGAIASIITHPLDVIKTFHQINLNTNITKTYKEIIKYNGYSGLFTGVIPRTCRIAPTCAIIITVYEYCKIKFNKNK